MGSTITNIGDALQSMGDEVLKHPGDLLTGPFAPILAYHQAVTSAQSQIENQENAVRGEAGRRQAEARAAALAPVQDEYDQRVKALTQQRSLDLDSMKQRLKDWGFDDSSLTWSTGLQSITSSYEDKLKGLNTDPYFSQVQMMSGWGSS